MNVKSTDKGNFKVRELENKGPEVDIAVIDSLIGESNLRYGIEDVFPSQLALIKVRESRKVADKYQLGGKHGIRMLFLMFSVLLMNIKDADVEEENELTPFFSKVRELDDYKPSVQMLGVLVAGAQKKHVRMLVQESRDCVAMLLTIPFFLCFSASAAWMKHVNGCRLSLISKMIISSSPTKVQLILVFRVPCKRLSS